MKNKKTIIMFVVVILIVGLAIYLSHQVTNLSTNETKNLTNTMNEIENNTIYLNNEFENNNTVATNVQNTTQNVISKTENTTGPDTQDGRKKAMDLVKADWGKDDSVYFYVDEVNEDGKYVVSVRDKETTSVVVWYDVDVSKNIAKMQ